MAMKPIFSLSVHESGARQINNKEQLTRYINKLKAGEYGIKIQPIHEVYSEQLHKFIWVHMTFMANYTGHGKWYCYKEYALPLFEFEEGYLTLSEMNHEQRIEGLGRLREFMLEEMEMEQEQERAVRLGN